MGLERASAQNDRAAWSGRVLGFLLAGAVGDALGAPIEFLPIEQIRARHGPDGLCDYVSLPSGLGEITDDTQMTLFTLEGLIKDHLRARTKGSEGATSNFLTNAYLRWLHTQQSDLPSPVDQPSWLTGWLVATPGLYSRRAPGNTCLASLAAINRGGTPGSVDTAINDSKGCGGVMRAAPAGLWPGHPAQVFRYGVKACAITHGHPSGYLSGGTLAVIVHQLLSGATLASAIITARAELIHWEGHQEQLSALDTAVALAGHGRPTPERITGHLGGGWVGEEALSIAVCAALTARDLPDGLLLAVNHSGDSDSTGSIAGNILGALHGACAIPATWLERLELYDTINTLAHDALVEFGPSPPVSATWLNRYAQD